VRRSSPGATVILGLLLAVCAAPADGQAPPTRAVFYGELGGNALYGGSVNVELMLTPNLSARVGASPFGAYPFMLNYLSGAGAHHLEAGFGLLASPEGSDRLATATLGYRYQRPGGGPLFRAGLTPLLGADGVAPWVGISLGFALPGREPEGFPHH
jgi:hypothetical protein